MTRSIVLRADANSEIGVGHAMRCLALAQALAARGITPVFASSELPESVRRRVEAEGFAVHDVKAPAGSTADVEETAGAMRAMNSEGLVVDGYQFTHDYHFKLQSLGARIALIDDYAVNRTPGTCLTINQNVYAPPSDEAGRYFSGLDYAMLRTDLRRPVAAVRAPAPRRVLVTMGGADPDNLSASIVEGCFGYASAVDLILGGVNPQSYTGDMWSGQDGDPVTMHRDVQSLAPFLSVADLAVVAAGGTMWEALHWGVPLVVIHRDDVQRRSALVLKERGVIVAECHAGEITRISVSRFVSAAFSDRHSLAVISEKSFQMVDGRGADRVAQLVAAM